MKAFFLIIAVGLFNFSSCSQRGKTKQQPHIFAADTIVVKDTAEVKIVEAIIEKDFLYNQYTLKDKYPYKDTARIFQWDKIRARLTWLDSIQKENSTWGILQNYKNKNGEAVLVKNFKRNKYNRVSDSLGIERYQSAPLFIKGDTSLAERYGRDGSLVKIIKDNGDHVDIGTLYFEGEWFVPKKYLKPLGDTVVFKNVIFVDRANQNVTTLEKVEGKWLVRSMNPATTGVNNPPYAKPTPLGIFVLQEKKSRMIYLKDGSQETGGFAPYASRFCNGGYIHGVPVNVPHTKMIEYSATLGTTPRSHMCVRNATSHAKFIYDWAPTEGSLVFVIE